MADKPNDMYAPTLPQGHKSESVLILTADDVHDLELFYPYYRLIEEGYKVDIASPKGGEIKGKAGWPVQNTKSIKDVNASSYALLYIPGGKAPEKLRDDKNVIEFVKQFAQTNKPIAAFCHGPQVLVTARLVQGKRLASWPGVEDEIKAEGGIFVNEPLVEDGQFITARWPGDLPGHLKAVLKRLQNSSEQLSRKAS